MATLPEYLTEQTEATIRQRMLDSLPADLDKAEGSYIWDSLSPAAIELALAATWAQEVLRRAFASTTFGSYLELRCEEHGLTRRAAVKAVGQVTFSGTAGTVISQGTRVSTAADPVAGAAAMEFVTTATAGIDASGSVAVSIEAVEAGALGNVVAGAITVLPMPVPGVSAVTNTAPTSGGVEAEDDASLLARFLQKARNPSTGGNKADYARWALEVAGVGGVVVIPVENGAGTVGMYVLGTDKKPASQALVDDVQCYIAPAHRLLHEESKFAIGGAGVSLDYTQADAVNGVAIKMVYDTLGTGLATEANLHAYLPQAGIWMVRPHFKIDSNAGTVDLVEVGVWNVSAAAWAKKSASSAEDAKVVVAASSLPTSLALTGTADPLVDARNWPISLDFYWNGQDYLELRITRLQTDQTTILWLDNAAYISTFSMITGEMQAPIGARVTVRPAIGTQVTVTATLTISSVYDPTAVRVAVTQNIQKYFEGIAFQADNDVRYARIGTAILDTPGVLDYSNLLVNGGTANIVVAENEVAVLGTVTLS